MTDVDGFRVQLRRLLRDNHAVRARLADVLEGESPSCFKLAARSFRHFEESSALSALQIWKERGFSAEEVLEDGLYPEGPGSIAMLQDSE